MTCDDESRPMAASWTDALASISPVAALVSPDGLGVSVFFMGFDLVVSWWNSR
jgi:hypothetical protein